MSDDIRKKAYRAIDAYFDAGGPADFVIMARYDTVRNNMMTGADWYNRFIKEVDHEPVSWPDNASNEYIVAMVGDVYDKAAKRAAGINDKGDN